MTDRTELELCPDCGGLRVTELTSIGTTTISLDGGPEHPAELWIGAAPKPCDHAPARPQPQHTVRVTQLPVGLPRELAVKWGLIDPDQPIGPTPIQRALDILAPHLAWDHRYRP